MMKPKKNNNDIFGIKGASNKYLSNSNKFLNNKLPKSKPINTFNNFNVMPKSKPSKMFNVFPNNNSNQKAFTISSKQHSKIDFLGTNGKPVMKQTLYDNKLVKKYSDKDLDGSPNMFDCNPHRTSEDGMLSALGDFFKKTYEKVKEGKSIKESVGYGTEDYKQEMAKPEIASRLERTGKRIEQLEKSIKDKKLRFSAGRMNQSDYYKIGTEAVNPYEEYKKESEKVMAREIKTPAEIQRLKSDKEFFSKAENLSEAYDQAMDRGDYQHAKRIMKVRKKLGRSYKKQVNERNWMDKSLGFAEKGAMKVRDVAVGTITGVAQMRSPTGELSHESKLLSRGMKQQPYIDEKGVLRYHWVEDPTYAGQETVRAKRAGHKRIGQSYRLLQTIAGPQVTPLPPGISGKLGKVAKSTGQVKVYRTAKGSRYINTQRSATPSRKGAGRPAGSYQPEYEKYGGVMGYRKYVAQQNAIARMKRRAMMEQQSQQPQYQADEAQQPTQYEQVQYEQQQPQVQYEAETQSAPQQVQYEQQPTQYEQPQQQQVTYEYTQQRLAQPSSMEASGDIDFNQQMPPAPDISKGELRLKNQEEYQ